MSTGLKQESLPYAKADNVRSSLEIIIALIGYLITVGALYIVYTEAWWILYPFVCIIASLFMVKIFTLLHDCSHYSMFSSATANRWVGRFLSLFITMPFYSWKAEHDEHHSHVVDMEKINKGDIPLLTVERYKSLPSLKRLGYRIFRHPVFFLIFAPFLYFFIKSRFPAIFEKKVIWSVILTNIFVILIYIPIFLLVGFWTMVFVFASAAYIGGIIGILLFYLQHDYPGVEWYKTEDWEHEKASLTGSSLIILPAPLEWFSHAIGYHHIHHLNSKIPGYRLRECFDAVSEFRSVKPLSWPDVIEAFRLKIWSYEENRLVTFDEVPSLRT